MSFCEHCEGQRFDRARVLRALRQVRKDVQRGKCRSAEEALQRALAAIQALEIPHLDWEDEGGQVVH
jgi:hypothetical protein